MKALTIWQPWASLIMIGAKPVEWRKWSYAARFPSLLDQRIVIHAGARPIKRGEVQDILMRIAEGSSSLRDELAKPFLEKVLLQPGMLPLAAGLGTATLRRPITARAFARSAGVNDSDRVDHSLFAWPLDEIQRFEPIVPMRGFQGFWDWPEKAAA